MQLKSDYKLTFCFTVIEICHFMSLQGCSGVKEVVSTGPVWVAAGQEAEIRAVQAGQVPPVQGVLSTMWNFMSTFDFDLRIHACLLYLPASYYTSHPGLEFVFEPLCHFSYPNPSQLRSTVAALKMQIQELGDALKSTVAGHHTNCNTSNSVSSYAAAVNQGNQGIGGTGGGGRNGGSGGCGRAGGRGDHGSSGRNGGSGGGERTGGRSIHGGSGRNGGSGGGGRAGGRGTRGGHEGNGGLVGSGQRGDNRYGSGAIGREVGHKTKDGVSSGKAVQREVVSGVRRLWGTVKSASHFSVKNTIVKLAKVENVDSIQVKRKQETTRTGKPKWWYVIHAEEDAILKPLETKWENVNIQTGWHLEPCTKPVEDTTLAPLAHSNQDNGVDTGVLSNGTNQPCNEDAPTDTIVLSTSIVTNTCPPGEPDQLFDISSPTIPPP